MRWLTVLMLVAVMGVSSALRADDEPSPVAASANEDDSARQLRIYREALLQGSNDEIRSDAAMGLLLRRDAAGHELLVSTLGQSDNPRARLAICHALIKSRASGETVESLSLYWEPLVELLEDSDSDVAAAAEAVLQEAFGIPAGTSRQVWEQIVGELKQKGLNEIRRERLLRQEMRLREIEAERDRWQRLYMTALDRQYDGSDEAARNAMILERLDSDLAPIRLWALEKVDRFPANGQAAWREKLLALLGDEVRQIRLKTARVLTNMSALNPADRLLERIGLERDSEVALAMFEALGEAVFFAFSPGSKIELDAKVKLETLEIGGGYVQSDDVDTAKKGAEIVRKLLELNNLDEDVAERYLAVLAGRYEVSVERNTPLRGDLLAMLVRLSERGPHRQKAVERFLPYFVEAVGVTDNPSVRLTAAGGLLSLDAAKALEVFKENELTEKGSTAVRQLVIQAAQQAGAASDLEWLAGLFGVNGLSEPATQAFGAICRRADAQTAVRWADNLKKAGANAEFVRELLEIAEQKAVTAKNEKLLAEVRIRLAEWLVQNKPSDLVVYLKKVKSDGGNLLFPDATGAMLIEALLADGQHDVAIELVAVRLGRESLGNESQILVKLDSYFQSETVDMEAKNAFISKLSDVKAGADIQTYQARLTQWRHVLEMDSPNQTPDKPQAVTQNEPQEQD